MTKTKKLLIAAVCLVAILTTAVVGTIAWLTDKTQTVTNTFSPSNIGLTLTEEGFNGKMVPGTEIIKKATVTVTNDIDCYVFIQVAESDNLDTFITYAMADGWAPVTDTTNVYYRLVEDDATVKAFSVLKNDKVTVNGSVTEGMMESLTDATKYPTLSFTAYACQKEGFADAAAAWTEAQKLDTNP